MNHLAINRFTVLLFLLLILNSCKKETSAPGISKELLGTWAEENSLQITIEDKVFECQCIKFIETKSNQGRYLDLYINGQKIRYQILDVQQNTLDLKDLEFNKTHNLKRVAI